MMTEDVIALAKNYIFEALQGFAYPVVPMDDEGNYFPYEVGCVPWVVCTNCHIVDASCDDEKDENGDWLVEVETLLTWVGEEDEEEEEEEVTATYVVIVGYDNGKLKCFDYERTD